MQLSVFGLGNAGAVIAACLVSQGHDVIATDRNAGKVDLIRRGLGAGERAWAGRIDR